MTTTNVLDDLVGEEIHRDSLVAMGELVKDWFLTSSLTETCDVRLAADSYRVQALKSGLGKEAEFAASETMRRAERRISQLIRQEQAEGRIKVVGSTPRDKPQPLSITEVTGFRNRSDVAPLHVLFDNVTDEQFEEALVKARAAGNLSRAEVSRQITGEVMQSSRSEWHRRKRRLDPDRVAREMAMALVAVADSVTLLDDSDVISQGVVDEWATSFQQSLRVLSRFRRIHFQTKES